MVVDRSDLSVATYSVVSSREVALASTILTGVGGNALAGAPRALLGRPAAASRGRKRQKCGGYRRPVVVHADDSLE